MEGYFKIYRSTFDSEIMDKPSEWFKIWVYIIGHANWEGKGVYSRGELITKYDYICRECRVKNTQVEKFLRWASSRDMVETQKLSRGVKILVKNYDKYQAISGTEEEQKLNTSGTINKGSIKNKRIKETNTECFDIFWTSYPNKVGKPNAIKKYKEQEHSQIIEGLERWKEYWDYSNTEQRYIPHPATWLHQERYKDTPPEIKSNIISV